MGVPKNTGTPKWMVYTVKWMIWVFFPHFLETPISFKPSAKICDHQYGIIHCCWGCDISAASRRVQRCPMSDPCSSTARVAGELVLLARDVLGKYGPL